MLTTKEIRKELDAGREVELEYLGGLDDQEHAKAYANFMRDNESIIVSGFENGCLTIKDSWYVISEIYYKYFRIKRPAPTLRDLTIGDKVFIREDLEDEKEYEFGLYFFKDSMPTGEQIISDVCGEGINIEGDDSNRYSYSMIDWEKTAELNAEKAPTFNDLIDVSIKAYKDGYIKKIELINDELDVTYKNNDGVVGFFTSKTKESGYQYEQYIFDIRSLYTETFELKDEDCLLKIKGDADVTLTNGNSFIAKELEHSFVSVSSEKQETRSIMFRNNEGFWTTYSIFELKGATVTQKRGEV